MPRTEIRFSQYSTAFYEIIDGSKSNKAEFMKGLLKMGLNDNGRQIIEDMFPTVVNLKGQRIIEQNKADQLRKYLRGDNGIRDIASNLEASLDKKLYIKELKEYEKSKLIEFAQCLNLYENTDNINTISKAITKLYVSIIKAAATQKVSRSNRSKDNSKSDKHSIVLPYTITESEKKALLNLCELIKKVLRDLQYQTDKICKKQHELINLTDSEKDKRWKPHLVYEIESLKNRLDEIYPKLEKLCVDMVELLEPKKDIHPTFSTFISIANNIGSNEYRVTCPDTFNYRTFSYMISKFNDNYDKILRDIDKL